MAIPTEKLMEAVVGLRIHLAVAAVVLAAAFALLSVGPSFATVVSFFWPLLLSTGFFLFAVAVLLRISPPPGESSGTDAGEKLMDYVAGKLEEEEAAAVGALAAEDEKGGAEPQQQQHQNAVEEPRTVGE